MSSTSIAIFGAAGRMGRRLVALTLEDPALSLAAAVDRADSDAINQDAGVLAGLPACNIKLASELSQKVDAIIDFTSAAGTRQALKIALATGSGLVIGSTGLNDEDHAAINEAAKAIPILQAPNMSLGVNLLFALAAQVAKRLGDDYDIEIVETHHRFKKDAPSGTALGIAQAICDATGKDMKKDLVHGREGDETTRTRGSIGMHALRSGDVVGKHIVTYGTHGEELTLAHNASTRDVFARGALKAGQWLKNKPAGRYQMKDVLEL